MSAKAAARQERKAKKMPAKIIRLPMTPKTEKQREYIEALHRNDQVVVLGPAGTGKTYVAAAVAADMLTEQKIDRIVLCRPFVTVEEEDTGALPGGLEEKCEPWVVPFLEAMADRMGSPAVGTALRNKTIEMVPLGFMRGRTFKNSVVILDEAQNCTLHQLKMFVTRMGEGSRMVINGDVSQTDLGNSGLATIVKMIGRYKIPAEVVEFTEKDVVRSETCRLWTEAFRAWEA